jgi:hypothetical protein
MPCIDEKSLDLRSAPELQRVLDSHNWNLEHYDQFGEDGVIVRFNCSGCGKEWTTLLLNPKSISKHSNVKP